MQTDRQSERSLCSESTLDYLICETVRHYQQRDSGTSTTPLHIALEGVGVRVGRALAERLTSDRPPMVESLDVMKWICKEFWNEVFLKSIDNLRTNHKGTYVLRDTQFRWTRRLAQNVVGGGDRLSNSQLAADYLVLPCGIVKGALEAFGIQAGVSADATTLPQCDFTVVVLPSSG